MVPMYSMTGPFRGHMSLKSNHPLLPEAFLALLNELGFFPHAAFSPGLSCKLSNQYIIQDHMVAHYKKLMSAKAAVDSSAPKSLHTSVKYKDQQKRHRLIQALQKYKDLVHGLPASAFNSRSVSPSQQKVRWSLLENGHLCLIPGWNDCSKTKREQPHFVSFQKPTSRTLMPAPTAKRTIQNTAQHVLSQTPVHNCSTDRSSASLLQSRMHSGSHNGKKAAFQNSSNKTYSGDLLDKHSVYFTEKQWFTPQILRTSHQSFIAKHRYYNPPPKKKVSSPGRPPLKSADVNNEKKRELHRFLEDAHVRPHSVHFSQQPVEQNHELQIPSYEMPLCSGSQIEEKEEDYLHFLQDLTNDILIRSCYHEEALEDVFQLHIKSKRYNLDEVKRRRIVQSLKKELNTINQPDPSIRCKGTPHKDPNDPATCF